jgi:hypothetical protein
MHNVGDSPGLDPVTADIALKRGVWIMGKVIDKATGKAVRAQVQYAVFEDNPHRQKSPALASESAETDPDGRFRLVGLPGRGLLATRASGEGYCMAVGADKIKGLDEEGHFRTFPYLLYARNFHTLVEVNPAEKADALAVEVVLDPGQTLSGSVLGPDGKPLTGVLVSGLTSNDSWQPQPLKTAEFKLTGLEQGQPRLLQFAHPEKSLAGFLVVKGNEKGPLRVKLGPAGTLTGRLVLPEGKPVKNVEIFALMAPSTARPGSAKPDLETGSFYTPRIYPAKDGKFRIDGLAPGLKYTLGILSGRYLLENSAAKNLTFKAGEKKDLGDVQVKPME